MTRDFKRAVELNGGTESRLGIGLVGFTGSWLVDTAISLRPYALVSPHPSYQNTAQQDRAPPVALD